MASPAQSTGTRRNHAGSRWRLTTREREEAALQRAASTRTAASRREFPFPFARQHDRLHQRRHRSGTAHVGFRLAGKAYSWPTHPLQRGIDEPAKANTKGDEDKAPEDGFHFHRSLGFGFGLRRSWRDRALRPEAGFGSGAEDSVSHCPASVRQAVAESRKRCFVSSSVSDQGHDLSCRPTFTRQQSFSIQIAFAAASTAAAGIGEVIGSVPR